MCTEKQAEMQTINISVSNWTAWLASCPNASIIFLSMSTDQTHHQPDSELLLRFVPALADTQQEVVGRVQHHVTTGPLLHIPQSADRVHISKTVKDTALHIDLKKIKNNCFKETHAHSRSNRIPSPTRVDLVYRALSWRVNRAFLLVPEALIAGVSVCLTTPTYKLKTIT